MIRFICNVGDVGEFLGVQHIEIDGRSYTPDEVAQIVRAHSSDGASTVSVRGAHKELEAFCEVSDCGEKRTGLSRYCKKHEMRYRRHGDPTVVLRAWDRKKQA